MDLDEQTQKTIFQVLDIDDLPEEEKGALLAKMIDVIQGRALLRIFDALSPEDQEALDKIIDEGKVQDMEALLTSKVPNLQEIFIEEAKKLRQELILKNSK